MANRADGDRETSAPIEILLVEDNPGDARLTEIAFQEGVIPNRIHVAQDGVEALEYLNRQGAFADAVEPDIILLDLNLPRKDGREVLEEIKMDPHLRRIPVVVLTTSESDQDILRAYDLHANSYITKPVEFDKFMEVIRSIEGFWLVRARLPKRFAKKE